MRAESGGNVRVLSRTSDQKTACGTCTRSKPIARALCAARTNNSIAKIVSARGKIAARHAIEALRTKACGITDQAFTSSSTVALASAKTRTMLRTMPTIPVTTPIGSAESAYPKPRDATKVYTKSITMTAHERSRQRSQTADGETGVSDASAQTNAYTMVVRIGKTIA